MAPAKIKYPGNSHKRWAVHIDLHSDGDTDGFLNLLEEYLKTAHARAEAREDLAKHPHKSGVRARFEHSDRAYRRARSELSRRPWGCTERWLDITLRLNGQFKKPPSANDLRRFLDGEKSH